MDCGRSLDSRPNMSAGMRRLKLFQDKLEIALIS
jgi:hypothetical protein